MAFLDIRNVLEKLSEELLEIEWAPEGENPESLFDAVGFYWSTDVKEALKKLYHYKGSLALIIPNDLNHDSNKSPDEVEVHRSINLDVCITSRSYGISKSKAEKYVGLKQKHDGSWDVNDSELGMLGHAIAVIDNLAGKTFGGWKTPITPNRAVPINLEDTQGIRPSFLINFTLQLGRNGYLLEDNTI